MIVDDEPLVRSTFTHMIDWPCFGFQVVAEAGNGKVALEKLLTEDIDILVTDIEMPVMDGLSLIREAKRHNPDLHIAIISVYDQYHYVRSAFQLGAEEYFLKDEMIPEVWLEGLLKISHRSNEHRDLARLSEEGLVKLRSEFVRRLIWDSTLKEGQISETVDRLHFRISDKCIAVAKMESWCSCKGDRQSTSEKVQTFLLSAASLIREKDLGYSCETGQDELVIVLTGVNCSNAKEMNEYIEICMEEAAVSCPDIKWAMGISRVANSLSLCSELYRQAQAALEYHFVQYESNTVCFGDIPKDLSSADSKSGYQEILQGFRELDEKKVLEAVHRLTQSIRQSGMRDRDCIRAVFLKLFLEMNGELAEKNTSLEMLTDIDGNSESYKVRNHEIDMGENMESGMEKNPMTVLINLRDLREMELWWTAHLSMAIHTLIKLGGGYIDPILRATQFIRDNFQKHISLDEAAAAAGLSPAYFCKRFQRKNGKKFAAYVADLRIEKAKQLIETTDKLVYELSGECGFDSPEYFCRSFRKITGMSPGEYKASLKNNYPG